MLIRPATLADAEPLADLAAQLAQSFPFARTAFDASFPVLVTDEHARILIAVAGQVTVGYCLGFRHLTFYANGPVATVEEILVSPTVRGTGVGRLLMAAFEGWAVEQGCAVVALATRRAAPFYRALDYEESAAYFRKRLPIA